MYAKLTRPRTVLADKDQRVRWKLIVLTCCTRRRFSRGEFQVDDEREVVGAEVRAEAPITNDEVIAV